MLNVTRLLCGTAQPADGLRYGLGKDAPRSARERRPVVVWNITRRCNLRCLHCYSDSDNLNYPGELLEGDWRAMLEDLADFNIPALLISGGEPTIHPQFRAIVGYARELGLRVTVSTNGTLLSESLVDYLCSVGVTYVGISLDGIGAVHDKFRGKVGTFDKVQSAFNLCREAEVKVGLRLTLTPYTCENLKEVFEFVEENQVPRVCFYHLVHSGRGEGLVRLQCEKERQAMDVIFDQTKKWHAQGDQREVLTVDQPADGAYLYCRLLAEDPVRADEVYDLLTWNGGGANSSGLGIACIDGFGEVHPDQFWHSYSLGNVRERRFSEIWQDEEEPLLKGLRERRLRLQGRCRDCRFQAICGGGFRFRAQQQFGNPWTEDPGCYLPRELTQSSF